MSGETTAPLQGAALALSALAISAIAFVEVLDMTIVNVAIPAIAGGLGASPTEATWAISSYAMAAATMQPLTGWLSKRFGQVHLFVMAIVLFTLSSALCGMAWDMKSLVAFRLLQGFVSGPMLPLSQALMLASFPPSKRGIALGLWASTVLVAPIFGPVLGGWISDNWSWRACFYINIPVGLMAASVIWATLKRRDSQPVREPIDIAGALLLIVGIASLQFMLDHGNQDDWFESNLIVGLGCLSLLAVLFFAIWEKYERFPIIDFSLFRYRSFSVSLFASAISYGAFFSSMIMHPLWMQTGLGYTATQAGQALIGYGIAALLTSLIFGTVMHRVSLHGASIVGLGCFAAGAVLQTQLTMESSLNQHFWARVPQGFGMALFQMCMTSMALSELPMHKYPAASGLMSFFRVLMASIVVALSVWLWDERTQVHHALLAEGVNPVSAANISFLQSLGEGATGMGMLDMQATLQSKALAFADICWLSAAIFVMLMPLILTVPRIKPRKVEIGH